MAGYLYPAQRKIEVLSAIYAGGLGIYTGGVWSLWGMTPFYWLTSDQIGLAVCLVAASLIWSLGIRINGAWWFSPFLRMAGMLAFLFFGLWASIAANWSSAFYTYGWMTVFLMIGAENAARDCVNSWRRKWAKSN